MTSILLCKWAKRIVSQAILIVLIVLNRSALSDPPQFIIGDCIGEVAAGLEVVGPFTCYGTCPWYIIPDPGRCVFIGDDYEPIWAQVINYENTGTLTWLHYLDWDCKYLLSDQCWYFDCPEEVLFEGYNDIWYNWIERDPECPK